MNQMYLTALFHLLNKLFPPGDCRHSLTWDPERGCLALTLKTDRGFWPIILDDPQDFEKTPEELVGIIRQMAAANQAIQKFNGMTDAEFQQALEEAGNLSQPTPPSISRQTVELDYDLLAQVLEQAEAANVMIGLIHRLNPKGWYYMVCFEGDNGTFFTHAYPHADQASVDMLRILQDVNSHGQKAAETGMSQKELSDRWWYEKAGYRPNPENTRLLDAAQKVVDQVREMSTEELQQRLEEVGNSTSIFDGVLPDLSKKPGHKVQFKVGDTVVCVRSHASGVERKITAVRETGYTWVYPHTPDRTFITENSSDPFLELGWVKQSDLKDNYMYGRELDVVTTTHPVGSEVGIIVADTDSTILGPAPKPPVIPRHIVELAQSVMAWWAEHKNDTGSSYDMWKVYDEEPPLVTQAQAILTGLDRQYRYDPLLPDFSRLYEVLDLAQKAQVSFGLHYCEVAREWYFSITSPADAENFMGKDRGFFENAVDDVLTHLKSIQPQP
jgi:hypothetical protein